MSAPRRISPAAIVHQPAAQFYDRFAEGIKQRIRTAQIKAALAAQARDLEQTIIGSAWNFRMRHRRSFTRFSRPRRSAGIRSEP